MPTIHFIPYTYTESLYKCIRSVYLLVIYPKVYTDYYMNLIRHSSPYIFHIRLCVQLVYDLSKKLKGPYTDNFMQ